MMGQLPPGQNALFYEFSIDNHVPEDHLLRALDQFLDFGELRTYLQPYYSAIGRPSIDPELMIRMLLIGYCYGIRSERRLCEEVHLNLAYRWFCRLSLEDQVPNHSTFSKNRHGRYRDAELFRHVFESVVTRCMDEGLVAGEGFAIDASIIKADANRARGFPGNEGVDWERPGRKTRAVREYLDALDNDSEQITTHEATRKAISLTDPSSCWTSSVGGPAFYAYSTNYLIDTQCAIIVDARGCSATLSQERAAARSMLDYAEERFSLKPEVLIGDTGYGSADLLGWLVEEKQITPHIPVLDKSEGKQELFGRSDFTWDPEQDHYLCPAGKSVGRNHRNFKNKRSGITKRNTIIYRASQSDCETCFLKSRCSPTTPARKIERSIHEAARDLVRSLKHTDAYEQSRNTRKKVEMLFGHLKRIMRFDRLRLRGPNGANDEFLLAATVQNLRKMAKLLGHPNERGLITT
jgi:transposase